MTPRSTATGGANGSGGAAAMATGGTGPGGGPPSGGMNTGGANAGGSAGTTPAGVGGAAPPVAPPLVDISGRWGMFVFEDPVGVQLVQAPDGTLTGRGCVAGAPGSSRSNPPLLSPEWCGMITGEVKGRSAAFGFNFEGDTIRYSTRVTVSEDGRRMTGSFSNSPPDSIKVSDLGYSISWLHVAGDANWLPYQLPGQGESALGGGYELALVPEDSLGSEFVAGRTYLIVYAGDHIRGDFGSFWHSEMSTAGDVVRVGPVPATTPELPVSLSLILGDNAISRVTATMPSGGRYTFTATRRPPAILEK
jgi:hypothetical protein